MAEIDFERSVSDLFDATPAFADADRFARRIEARVARRGRVRRVALIASTVAGGGVAFGGVVATGAAQHMLAAFGALQGVVQAWPQGVAAANLALPSLPGGLPLPLIALAMLAAGGAWTVNRMEIV